MYRLFALLFSMTAMASPATQQIDLLQDYQPPIEKGSADLFIPLPLKSPGYQKILKETYTSNALWVKEEQVSLDKTGDTVRILHAHWDKIDKPALKLHEVIEVSDRDGGLASQSADLFFLQPTEHVQTDGLVKETAKKITDGISDPDKKAQAIYNWIVDNTFRDAKVRGCGLGDVKTTLQSGHMGGKCADLNSVFVGLARASGIPAREVWGLRVAPSNRSKSLGKEGDVSKSQHCRAEYYSSPQKAWVPVDPADIRKVILEENLTLNDPHVKELRSRFFGSWEGNWIALNFGRDIHLSNGKKLNFMMYPQLFTELTSTDGVDPKETGYKFTSTLLAK